MASRRGWRLVGAIVVTGGFSLAAYFASQPAFAATPPLASPGSVFVGVRQGSASAPVRVDVHMAVQPSPSRTTFRLGLLGDPSSSVPLEKAGDLILGFCGAMKDVRLQTSADAETLALLPLIPASGLDTSTNAFGAEFSLRDDCRIAVISKHELTDVNFGEGGTSWALFIEGETTAATEASAGAQHRYVLPRIATATLPLEGLKMDSVAVGSEASMEPDKLPQEYVPTVVSPQVDDIGAPAWEFPIQSAGRIEGYRLTGTDQREQAEIQSLLFLASGFAGVAGGGLIWLFDSWGALKYRDRSLAKTRPGEFNTFPQTEAYPRNLADASNNPSLHSANKLFVVSVLVGIAGSTLTWLVTKRRHR